MFELIDMLIVRPITNILFVVYGFVGDFGLAIILFTLLVKIFMWPLVKRQLHQTRLMRKIQPELAEIKKNCNGNRQLESLQMMDLYKRNNIKPFRSMLTLVIQLPIFIALYTAVRVMVQPNLSDNLEKRAYSFVAQIDKVDQVIQLQQPYLSYQQTIQNIRNDSNLNDEHEKEDNDFDDLMDNYDEENQQDTKNSSNSSGKHSASNKLSDVTTTQIYKTLKKLVSISYEKYQKGTYKYNKKEVVKHYLTNQKFRIMDDLISPTFKPDVYVFDLSPSNDSSLEMYVNAISSVAVKGSLIYLTYNESILRKIEMKKALPHGINVHKVANGFVQKYNGFECTIYDDDNRTLYDELKNIRDRKIYVFSDFDISSDISRLSQENPEIVWFSTEKSGYGSFDYDPFFYREYPTSYIGYYVETSDIKDIERYISEKNKSKYKRRPL